MKKNKLKCKLCGNYFDDNEMSEEHYPARSVGNDDIVAVDLAKTIDMLLSNEIKNKIINRVENGENLKQVSDDLFDNELATPLYPHGRTARSLCKKCNTFLGKYGEAYLKFFNIDGDPKKIKGFSEKTKYQIIKSIFGKFLSIPETLEENFDFLDFLKDDTNKEYLGVWNLYFVKRDHSSDILGLKNIDTGKLEFEAGVVYELSDDKFIYNLMNFKKHDSYKMTNIFDILKKNYVLTNGVGESGGYHALIFISKLFSEK